MDISEIKPTEREIEIMFPNGDPSGIMVTIMSPDDARMKTIIRRVTDKNLELKRKNKTPSAVEIEENETALVGATIVDWNWSKSDLTLDGKKPDCTPVNVRKVVSTVPWFKAQLAEELGDTKSFFTT